MKEICFLLLFLLPYSLNSYYIKQIIIDNYATESLYTFTGYNYFYIELKSKSYDYPVYFYLFDTSYRLDKHDYCITSKRIISDSTIDECQFNYLYLEHFRNVGDSVENYFKIDINAHLNNRYIIVRYSGSYMYGSLYAKSSYSDLYKLPDSTSRSFSTVNIVFIAIALLALIGIIITIICYYCKKKGSTNVTNASNEPPVEPISPDALLPENEINPSQINNNKS